MTKKKLYIIKNIKMYQLYYSLYIQQYKKMNEDVRKYNIYIILYLYNLINKSA